MYTITVPVFINLLKEHQAQIDQELSGPLRMLPQVNLTIMHIVIHNTYIMGECNYLRKLLPILACVDGETCL